jgi:hypothetical protein
MQSIVKFYSSKEKKAFFAYILIVSVEWIEAI